MRKLLLTSALVLMALPGVCSAATTTWNMEGVAKLEGWNHRGFASINLTPDGLVLETAGESQGQLARPGPIRHNVDTITITYSSPTGAEGIFFWQTPDQDGNEAYNIPMRFSPSPNTTSMVLDVSNLPEWTPDSKLIGFNFNIGAQVVLKKIELKGPGLLDTLINSAQSVWKFDELGGYTVNFLWGPRMVSTPEAIPLVFKDMPPLGKSWNKALYIVLGIVLAGAIAYDRKTRRGWLKPFLLSFAVIWLIYDLRMGAEIVSYAQADWNTWWSKPIELQDYRDRGSFTAYTKIAKEYAKDEERYALITPSGWPYFGTMTYETYPALPVAPTEDLSDVSLWLVYRMRNVRVDEQNRLTLDGEPISPPGEILLNFEPGAFMFRSDS